MIIIIYTMPVLKCQDIELIQCDLPPKNGASSCVRPAITEGGSEWPGRRSNRGRPSTGRAGPRPTWTGGVPLAAQNHGRRRPAFQFQATFLRAEFGLVWAGQAIFLRHALFRA